MLQRNLMKAQSKEGHINKILERKVKIGFRSQKEKKNYTPQKHRRREGVRRTKKQ